MTDKPFHEMSDDELRSEHDKWAQLVEDASGWSSAFFAAKQLEAIVMIGNWRGLEMTNPHLIRAWDATRD